MKDIDLIGCHDHTIRHPPVHRSFLDRAIATARQIGYALVIAKRNGIVTVGDFRPADRVFPWCRCSIG